MDEDRPSRPLVTLGIAAFALAAFLALLIVVLVPGDAERSWERSLLAGGPFLTALIGIVLLVAGILRPPARRDLVLGVLTTIFAVLAPILFHTGLVFGVSYPLDGGLPIVNPWGWWMMPLGAVLGPLSVGLIVIGLLRRWPRVPLVVAICAVIVGTIPVLLVLFSGAITAGATP